jgi:Helix-turn-helix domain
MRPGKRFGLSAIEKSDIWCRWKAGESLHEIGRAFDKPHSSIRCLLLPRGGIPPAARRRSRLALTLAEREDISRGIASDSPLREIAQRLDRAASTVSREISRHGGRPAYRAHVADDHAWDLALRPKKCLQASTGPNILERLQRTSKNCLLVRVSRCGDHLQKRYGLEIKTAMHRIGEEVD